MGTHVGTDQMGNRYYENNNPMEEVPGMSRCPDLADMARRLIEYILTVAGRQRWVDYAQDDFNASQAVPEWHSWLHHIRKDPPPTDPIMNASRPPWLAVSVFRIAARGGGSRL